MGNITNNKQDALPVIAVDTNGDYVSAFGAGVSSINGEVGPAITINSAGSGITIISTANTITISGSTAMAGDVVGPASATASSFALFDTTTGKLIKESQNLTYSGNTLTAVSGLTISSSGSMVLYSASGISTVGALIPTVNSADNLGDPTHRYNSIHINNIVGSIDMVGDINISGSITPWTSGTHAVGTPAFPFGNVYAVSGNFHALGGMSPIQIDSDMIFVDSNIVLSGTSQISGSSVTFNVDNDIYLQTTNTNNAVTILDASGNVEIKGYQDVTIFTNNSSGTVYFGPTDVSSTMNIRPTSSGTLTLGTADYPFSTIHTHAIIVSGVNGGGDIFGPTSGTDNALAVYDGYTGKLLKNSSIKVNTTTLESDSSIALNANAGGVVYPTLLLNANGNIDLDSGLGGESYIHMTAATVTVGSASGINTIGDILPTASGVNSLGASGLNFTYVHAIPVFASPNGSLWKLTVDDAGIVSGIAF